MSAGQAQIRIDSEIQEQAAALFADLGLDISEAINIFLHQCIIRRGIPFHIEMPRYSDRMIAAIDEAARISRDPNVPGYENMEDLKKALEE